MENIKETTLVVEPTSITPIVIIDTNILMSIPRIHEFEWGLPAINIFILNSVVEELRGLKRERVDMEKSRKAQRAYDILDNLQKRTPSTGLPLRGEKDKLFFVEAPEEISSPLDPDSVDHHQIAFMHSSA